MSRWFEAKAKDLSYSLDGKDLHIHIDVDESGNVYTSVPVEAVRAFLRNKPPVMKYPKETKWTPKKK